MLSSKKDILDISRNVSFSKVLNKKDLPGYIKHYILEDENVLVAYKTSRDHAIFTDNKVVIFDTIKKINRKEIYTLSYNNIIAISITFDVIDAELDLYLECGHPVKLKFIDLEAEDKIRLRLLYTYLSRRISNEKIPKDLYIRLIKDDVRFITNPKAFEEE
jgi:hypothetical protein